MIYGMSNIGWRTSYPRLNQSHQNAVMPNQDVINKRVSEDIVLDVGENEKIIGIEILDASRHVALDKLLPVKHEVAKAF